MNLQQRYRSKLIYGVKRIHNSRAMGRGIGLFLMALLLICVNGCTMQSSKGPNNEVEDTRVTKEMVSGDCAYICSHHTESRAFYVLL